MAYKMLTIDDLYKFFVEQNQSVHFDMHETHQQIVVSVPGQFELSESDYPGMLRTKLKVCHLYRNRNNSYISKENMEKAMPTIKYRPILAYIHQLADGTYDFWAHNTETINDKDHPIKYLESQVGCFSADDPYLEYDEENDKTYVIAYAFIPEEYTRAADIIRSKNGTKVSCELVINELSYNAQEKYLELIDFYFGGTTLLGKDDDGNEIGEGMLGARLDIADFCNKQPSLSCQEKLVEVLEKLNFTLSGFNIEDSKKGGSCVVESENVVNINDEQVNDDAVLGTDITADDSIVLSNDSSLAGMSVLDADTNNTENHDVSFVKPKHYEVDEHGNGTLVFEISHEDIRSALYNLISVYEDNDGEWYYIVSVYDNYFYMENWEGTKLYKQDYSVDGDNVALSGDRVEMFRMIVSDAEKQAIENLRQQYEDLQEKYNVLKEFKDNYDLEILREQKRNLLNNTAYQQIVDDNDFKMLQADMDKYSIDDLQVKCDLLLAAYVKHNQFSDSNVTSTKHAVSTLLNNKSSRKKLAYAGLFES